MARTKKQPVAVTRAEKKDATKNIIREVLAVKPYKHNELIEETAKLYTQRFGGEDTENVNDVKGRVGSVLDIMKKDSDIMYDGGMYALKARLPMPPTAETPEEKPAKKASRTKKTAVKTEAVKTEILEEKPAKKTARKSAKKTEKKAEPLPVAPLQPIAPVAPVTPETAPEPIPEKTEEKPAPKKRGRKPKAKTEEAKSVPTPAPAPTESETPEKTEIVPLPQESPKAPREEEPAPEKQDETKKTELVAKEKGELAKAPIVMDMSFLFGDKKPTKPAIKADEKPTDKTEEKPLPLQPVQPAPVQAAEKPVKAETKEEPVKSEPLKAVEKRAPVQNRIRATIKKPVQKPLTADEKLQESFLKRLRALGGDYFEYYSVYLLERYSMKNGRRLEGLKISGGDHDGGIDGEIELTDKLGFRETIYIQSKNWNPDKGDERLWVVGETLLQQFIGACACRQAKDKKQHCRGIFITTSRFTPDAKRILNDLSDKIVGYDGEDLYEAAKECKFGLLYENGNWKLDEKLLSGTKAFFNML